MASTQQHGLLSPTVTAGSPASSNTSSAFVVSPLPTPRQQQSTSTYYISDKLHYIERRYATKYTNITTEADEAPGYTDYDQFIADLDPLVNRIWKTGTPSVQIAYMLQFADLVASYIPAFPFTQTIFPFIRKLDTVFSTLLRREPAAGQSRQAVSTTEKVRIRSLVERTRVVAMHHASSAGFSAEANENDAFDSDFATVVDGLESDVETAIDNRDGDDSMEEESSADVLSAGQESTALLLAKIYESTISILGDTLGKPVLPMQTDDLMADE